MIYVGADHKGLALKVAINTWLKLRGYEFEDRGAYEHVADDDYVDVGIDVAQRTAERSDTNRGILICGSGVGMDVAANKVERVRCVLGFNLDQVRLARRDDNVNVLALAADFVDGRQAVLLVEKFLVSEFVESDKYLRRIEKMNRFERVT
jgi:ribose 5-phosphate isomerase B